MSQAQLAKVRSKLYASKAKNKEKRLKVKTGRR